MNDDGNLVFGLEDSIQHDTNGQFSPLFRTEIHTARQIVCQKTVHGSYTSMIHRVTQGTLVLNGSQ